MAAPLAKWHCQVLLRLGGTSTDGDSSAQIITCTRNLLGMSLKDALQADAGTFEQAKLSSPPMNIQNIPLSKYRTFALSAMLHMFMT